MDTFMAFCIGVLFGAFLGAMAMLLFIRETRMDLEADVEDTDPADHPLLHCLTPPAPELEWEDDLDNPQEVKYGEF